MVKKNNKPSIKKKEETVKPEMIEIDKESIYLTIVPHVLSENMINLWTAATFKERDRVSPPTPDLEQVEFEREAIEPLPTIYPNLDLLQLPYVRLVGIKSCIELLGRFFNCISYKTNHLHYWFLDVVTDCLWKLQDDFQLPDDDQKKVLEYFLYFFKIIINSKLNYSRKAFLRTFKEAIYLIGDLIEEGCSVIPTPDDLFTFTEHVDNDDNDSENIFATSVTTVTDSANEDVETHVGVKVENAILIYNLKKHMLTDNLVDAASKASSFDPKKLQSDDSLTLPATLTNKAQKEAEIVNIMESMQSNTVVAKAVASLTYDTTHSALTDPNVDQQQIPETFNISDFYQPDLSTPPRFLSSELAFARYRANEVDYLADGAEEDFEYGDIIVDTDSSSSVWTIGDSEHNGDQDAGKSDKFDKSQLSDISKYLSKTDPCIVTIHEPLRKKSTKIQEHSTKSHPSKQSHVSVLAKVSTDREGGPAIVTASVHQMQDYPSFSSLSDTLSTNTINLLIRARRKLKRDKYLKTWRDYNLFEQRLENMANPQVGWQLEDHLATGKNGELLSTECTECTECSEPMLDKDVSRWRELIHVKHYNAASRQVEERKRINVVIASAIIDCVFEFLYDNFHFTLIKLAFQSTPDLINQNVNYDWNCPKIPKVEFSRPPRTKSKPPKVKKDKKSKSKSTKSSKKSSKKSKTSKKSAKSKKPKKDKKSGKSSKSSKSGKLSKSEMDRIKKEKALLEEERRKAEENKRFMFPLTDAATDDLFQNIFENWVKVNRLKGEKKVKGKKVKQHRK